jgi:hypothetical protein
MGLGKSFKIVRSMIETDFDYFFTREFPCSISEHYDRVRKRRHKPGKTPQGLEFFTDLPVFCNYLNGIQVFLNITEKNCVQRVITIQNNFSFFPEQSKRLPGRAIKWTRQIIRKNHIDLLLHW